MHSHLKDLVIVDAVGQPGLVTKDDVKEGVIVDVGILQMRMVN